MAEPEIEECGCKILVSQITPGKRFIVWCPRHDAADAMLRALEGMMEIAEMAMPDSYFQTDRRVRAARAAIAQAKKGPSLPGVSTARHSALAPGASNRPPPEPLPPTL